MFQIKNRKISQNHYPYIIAEMSANHDQSIKSAMSLLSKLVDSGVDAIKLQTYTADTITFDSNRPEFIINSKKSLWNGRRLYDLYKQGSMPWEWHKEIFSYLNDRKIHCFSTPFDFSAVDFLEQFNVPAYKIASSEITDVNLIKYIGDTGKPVIMSTGMANLAEIHEAVNALERSNCKNYALLKCTANYPTLPKDVNALSIKYLRDLFGCEVGLSDHTLGMGASIAAVALGATIIEKHVALSRKKDGVDSKFSMEPDEMKLLVNESRVARDSVGSVKIGPNKDELSNLKFRRSLYIVEDLLAGDTLTQKNVRSIRPSNGLHPRYLDIILGKKISKNVKKGTPLSWNLL
jgi:pseudaminic acid synthase